MKRAIVLLVCAFVVGVVRAEPDACAARWSVEGLTLGGELGVTRSTLEAAGAKPGRVTVRASYFSQPIQRSDKCSFELGGQGKSPEKAIVDRITFVQPTPQGGGDAFLNGWLARWGEPTHRTTRRDDQRVGAISEAWVWLDVGCDIRAVVLVRREITPRGAALRYGSVELQRVSSIVKDLDAFERTADKLGGL
ncbi:MAG: hypothetical protein U0V87_05530 [Acidobacteriota bacterium]